MFQSMSGQRQVRRCSRGHPPKACFWSIKRNIEHEVFNIVMVLVKPAALSEKGDKSGSQPQHAAHNEPEAPSVFQKWHTGKIHAVKSGDKGQRHENPGDDGQDA